MSFLQAQQDVGLFQTHFRQWDGETLLSSPIPKDEVELNTYKLRLKLTLEETFELLEATATKEYYNSVFQPLLDQINEGINNISLETIEVKPVDILDAITDVSYVNFGMSNLLGLDLTSAWNEVQASNMSKLDEDGNPIFREDGKVLKGPNFFQPKLAELYNTTKFKYEQNF